MDFIGLRRIEQEIGEAWGLYNSYSLFYDQRNRRRVVDEYGYSQLLGMVAIEQESLGGDHHIRNNTFYKIDPYDKITSICEYYFSMPPKYIAVTDDTLFELNRESFRYWLGRVTNRLRFGSSTVLHSLESTRLPSELEETLEFTQPTKQLMKNYTRLPEEVVLSSVLGYKFGLPVVDNKDSSDDLEEKWLSLMTWVKLINTELHPTLCTLREGLEKTSRNFTSEKRSSLLSKLQCLSERCNELKASNNINISNFLCNEHNKLIKEKSNLPKLRVSGQKNREFFKFVIISSLDVTSSVIGYLSDITCQKPDEEICFTEFLTKITENVGNFHNSVKGMFKNKYIYSQFEAERCCQDLIKAIEKFISVQHRRKFTITAMFGENHEIRLRVLHRIQKFLRKLTEEVSSSLIQSLYQYYKLPLKKIYSKRLVMNLLLHIMWTAMNIVLNKRFFGEGEKLMSFERSARPLDISGAEIIITRAIMMECIRKVCREVQICETNLFRLRPEIIREITISLSYVYNEFPLYLQIFNGISRCNQSLLDMDALTDGVLKRFMTELVFCLHFNITAMEEVLGHAREYNKSFPQKKH